MRAALVGIDNPHSSDPHNALVPWPRGCTGWRIWQMIADHRPTVTKFDYRDGFERMNLDCLSPHLPGQTVVLLGDRVRQHYGLPKLLIHPVVRDGVEYRQVPHPSGMNRWYNDPTQRELVAMLLEELWRRGQR